MRKSAWKSRKFWAGIITFACVMANELWGIEIDPANLLAVVLPITAWIIGESVIDATHR